MKHTKNLASGFLAGLFIGLAGLIYGVVACSAGTVLETVLGSFMFSFGLLLVCSFGVKLYTGKIGYVLDNKPSYLIELGEMLLGNILGAVVVGFIVHCSSTYYASLITKVTAICNLKLAHEWYALLFQSMGCGILVYLAVECFKSNHHPIIRITGLILCITVMVAVGFTHIIAEMFFFTVLNLWNGETIVYLLLVLLGNSLGSIFLHLLFKIVKKEDKVIEQNNK